MGAPVGNQNAAKAKVWTAAVERAIERLGSGEILDDKDNRHPRVKGLDKLADQFVANVYSAQSHKPFAELADRLEGKPAQSVTLAGDPQNPLIQRVERVIVPVAGTESPVRSPEEKPEATIPQVPR